MNEREEIKKTLEQLVGEEACGMTCEEAEIVRGEEGWSLKMEGFMEPWKLGESVEEAKAALKEYASQGFGLTESRH